MPFDRARPVPEAALRQIVEAARWAPTAHNMQNFELVVVDDPALLARLGAIRPEVSETFVRENYAQLSFSEDELRRRRVGILGTMFPPSWRRPDAPLEELRREAKSSLHDTIQDSPALVVVLYDPARRAPASEGDLLGIMSLGCVLENMWLVAQDLGVGFQVMSVFAGAPVEPAVKELLGIPVALRIAFAVRLGYPPAAAPPAVRVRRYPAELAHRNRYGGGL
jgi:nitroreductase